MIPDDRLNDIISKKEMMLIPDDELKSLKRELLPSITLEQLKLVKMQEISDGILFFIGEELGERIYVGAVGCLRHRVYKFNMRHETSNPFYPDATISTLCKRGIHFTHQNI